MNKQLKIDVPAHQLENVMDCIRLRVVEIDANKKRYEHGHTVPVTLHLEPVAHSIGDYDSIKTIGNREEAVVPYFSLHVNDDRIRSLEGFKILRVIRSASQPEVSEIILHRELEPVVDLRDDGADEPDRTIQIDPDILCPSRNTTILRIKGWDGIEGFMKDHVGWKIVKVNPSLTTPGSPEECFAWISSPKEIQDQPTDQLMTLEEQHEFIELMKARKQLTQDQYDRCAEMVFKMVERRLRSQQAEAPADGSTD